MSLQPRPDRRLLRGLAERIRELETTRLPAERSGLSLGVAALDDGLPDGRLPAGSLVELHAADRGAGAWTLALFFARQACAAGRVLVVVDGRRSFYPPAAAGRGVDLERLILVHSETRRDASLAALESLRAPAVGAVLGWYEELPPGEFRRLQLAAEAGGGLGLLLRPATAVREPSFAALRLVVHPVPADGARRVRVDVARCRGGKAGHSLLLEIDDETGDVRVPAGLAAPAVAPRAARASG